MDGRRRDAMTIGGRSVVASGRGGGVVRRREGKDPFGRRKRTNVNASRRRTAIASRCAPRRIASFPARLLFSTANLTSSGGTSETLAPARASICARTSGGTSCPIAGGGDLGDFGFDVGGIGRDVGERADGGAGGRTARRRAASLDGGDATRRDAMRCERVRVRFRRGRGARAGRDARDGRRSTIEGEAFFASRGEKPPRAVRKYSSRLLF